MYAGSEFYERRKATVAARNAELAEEVEWWLRSNAGWGPMLRALGYHDADSLARRLRRSGRPDLARSVEGLTKWEHQEI